MSELPVIIAGAGPAGLALGIALLQRGQSVHVLERHGRARFICDAGGAYELTAGTLERLRGLGVLDAVRARGTDLTHFDLRDLRGATLQRLDFGRAGFCVFAITRAALQLALLERFEALGGSVTHEDYLAAIDVDGARVHAHCQSGASLEGSLLVGADGVHSSVRRLVFEPALPIDVGIAALWGRAPSEALDLPLGRSLGVLGGGRSLVVARVGTRDQPRTLFTVCSAVDASPLDRGELLRAWPSALRALLEQAHDVAETRIHAQRPLPSYARGPVVLVGDAAHGMPPFLGLGANSAIEDAVRVAGALSHEPASLARLGQQRAALLNPRIREARRLGALMHARTALGGLAFSMLTRLIPSALVLRQMRALHAPPARLLPAAATASR
jgi:2-polyprenyl-6-methoxyphenol hydroxylase-like FAD-dependent oxidoreductase